MKSIIYGVVAILAVSLNVTIAQAQPRADKGKCISLEINTFSTEYLSEYIFGHNLEHTRACVNGGISAQMLRNRKFAGMPSRSEGVAAHWFGIGEKTFFLLDPSKPYTAHISLEKMKRRNELNSQIVTNMTEGQAAGIGQNDIAVSSGTTYTLRTVTIVSEPLTLKVEICDRDGKQSYCSTEIALSPSDDWVTTQFEMTPSATDRSASVRYSFTRQAELRFGALSMMPSDNFHGMRRDVVDNLKAIGPSILRWPGGNFAGEYRWKDGLLEADQRGPLAAVMENETQPYSEGFDYHEINTDDFIALCREVGAEPFLTINLIWNTPEESAQWLEYCNGSEDSEYGKIRAQRGHAEPYNVKFWSLGNEMGYGHMEGPSQGSAYAELASGHAKALIALDPDLQVFSSGPYPNDVWAANSAAALADLAPYVSLHWYASPSSGMHYSTEEGVRDTYCQIVASADKNFELARKMRESLDRTGVRMHISYDEWNQWYSWYRPSCVAEGMYTARFLHGIIHNSAPLDIPVCCYFQPVGEGAIMISPTESHLSANGQVFALMSAHKGGRLCRISGADNYEAVATVKDNVLTVTLINESYDASEEFSLTLRGSLVSSRLLSSNDVRPYTYFNESDLEVSGGKNRFRVTLPPHSVASLVFNLH